MIGGVVLVVAVALPSSRRLQCGAGGCAATGQTGGWRDPLWKREETYIFTDLSSPFYINMCAAFMYLQYVTVFIFLLLLLFIIYQSMFGLAMFLCLMVLLSFMLSCFSNNGLYVEKEYTVCSFKNL